MSWLVQTTGKSYQTSCLCHQASYLCRTIGNSSLMKPVSSDLKFCTVKTIIVSVPQRLTSQPRLLISNWIVSASVRAPQTKTSPHQRYGEQPPHGLALSGPGKGHHAVVISSKAASWRRHSGVALPRKGSAGTRRPCRMTAEVQTKLGVFHLIHLMCPNPTIFLRKTIDCSERGDTES